MKPNFIIYLVLPFLMQVYACSPREQVTEQVAAPVRAAVTITHPHLGAMDEEIPLSGISTYLKRNAVSTPVPAFITQVYVKLGDNVKKGQALYQLESKERRALGNSSGTIDASLKNFGIITIKAPSSGIISTLDKQQIGDYVLEGTALCTIAESQNLAITLNVPYEYTAFAKTNTSCVITLPNGQVLSGHITTILTSMNAAAQTQQYLVKPDAVVFLPENLLVAIKLTKRKNANAVIVPKNTILADEEMKNFWIMKVINDSTAIKIPIIKGMINQDEVQILSPNLSVSDRIVLDGNYGLADTALIQIGK